MVDAVDAKQVFYRMLADENGDNDLIVDGSVTPKKFICGLGNRGTLHLARVNFILQSNSFNETGWFENSSPLTNGIEFRIADIETDKTIVSFNQEFRLKQNIHWGLITGSEVFLSTGFSGTRETAFIRWEIERSASRVLVRPGQCFQMIINDDLTGTNRIFHGMVQGFLTQDK